MNKPFLCYDYLRMQRRENEWLCYYRGKLHIKKTEGKALCGIEKRMKREDKMTLCDWDISDIDEDEKEECLCKICEKICS